MWLCSKMKAVPFSRIATFEQWSNHSVLRPLKQKVARKMFGSLTALFNRRRRNQERLSRPTKESQHSGIRRADESENILNEAGMSPQQLKRRWEYLAEAQKLSHSGIFAWDVSSGILEWSDETYRILGFTRETPLTLDLVFDRIHPEDRERLLELRDRAARDGMDLDAENRLLM